MCFPNFGSFWTFRSTFLQSLTFKNTTIMYNTLLDNIFCVPLKKWESLGFLHCAFSLWSSKSAFTNAFFVVVNHNYDDKQQTSKQRNRQNGSKSTIHKPWPFEPVEVNSCFLRGPPRWLVAAKNVNVSWLLNFRIHVFLKSAVISKWFSLDLGASIHVDNR